MLQQNTLKTAPLHDPACRKIVVHLGGAPRDLPPGANHEVVMNISEGKQGLRHRKQKPAAGGIRQ
jgi:hypothetical protein